MNYLFTAFIAVESYPSRRVGVFDPTQTVMILGYFCWLRFLTKWGIFAKIFHPTDLFTTFDPDYLGEMSEVKQWWKGLADELQTDIESEE